MKYNILIGHVERIHQNGRIILEQIKGKCIWALTGFIQPRIRSKGGLV
jgi:hypothetical protein